MSDDDSRQQMEQERQREELRHLVELNQAGMHELAEFFAADLGLTKEFQREICNA